MEEGDFDRAKSEKIINFYKQILVYMPQASCMSTVMHVNLTRQGI